MLAVEHTKSVDSMSSQELGSDDLLRGGKGIKAPVLQEGVQLALHSDSAGVPLEQELQLPMGGPQVPPAHSSQLFLQVLKRQQEHAG